MLRTCRPRRPLPSQPSNRSHRDRRHRKSTATGTSSRLVPHLETELTLRGEDERRARCSSSCAPLCRPGESEPDLEVVGEAADRREAQPHLKARSRRRPANELIVAPAAVKSHIVKQSSSPMNGAGLKAARQWHGESEGKLVVCLEDQWSPPRTCKGELRERWPHVEPPRLASFPSKFAQPGATLAAWSDR